MTRKRALKGLIVLSIAAGLALFAWPRQPLFAGSVWPTTCACVYTSNGGAFCRGSLQCFRDADDPNALATFSLLDYGSPQFSFAARYELNSMTCDVYDADRARSLNATFASLNPNDHFWVWTDNTGICREVYLYKSSDRL